MSLPVLSDSITGEYYFPSEETVIYDHPHSKKILSQVYSHTPLQITGESGGWLRVSIDGWIRRDKLRFHQDVLRVKSFTRGFFLLNPSRPVFLDEVDFELEMENISGRTIKSWAGLLAIMGDKGVLVNLKLSNKDISVGPGETDKLTLTVQGSHFNRPGRFKLLKRTSPESLYFDLKIYEADFD